MRINIRTVLLGAVVSMAMCTAVVLVLFWIINLVTHWGLEAIRPAVFLILLALLIGHVITIPFLVRRPELMTFPGEEIVDGQIRRTNK
jgi:hypothetical protein